MEKDNFKEAKDLLEKLEKANADTRSLIEKAEKLKVQEILGGKSEAGISSEPKVETPKDYAKRILAGNLGNLPSVSKDNALQGI